MGNTSVQAAPARDYAQETSETLQNQLNLAPQQYENEAKYQPMYTQLALQNAQTGLFGGNGQMGMLDMYKQLNPQLSEISAASNSAQRAADIADVENLGGQASAAFLNANPALKAQMDRASALQDRGPGSGQTMLEQQLQNRPTTSNLQANQVDTNSALRANQVGMNSSLRADQVNAQNLAAYDAFRVAPGQNVSGMMVNNPSIQAGQIQGGQLQNMLTQQAMNAGPSAISQALQAQALGGISQGGQLSAQEMRDATQATRAGYSSRGMGLSDQSVLGETQNRLINSRQRQMENLGLAGQINQQLIGETGANRAFQQSGLGQNVGIQGQNVSNNLDASRANQSTSMQAQMANQSMDMNSQQFNAQQYMQAQMANQAAQNQAMYQAQGLNAQNNMQAQMANQSANMQAGQFNNQQDMQAQMANQAANMQAGQFNNQQNMQGQLANQSANLQAGQFNQQFNQQALQQYLQNLGQLGQLQGQSTAADRGYAAQMAGLWQGTASDPFSAVLGRPSAAFNQAPGMQAGGTGLQQLAGPALFNPESSYANNIYGGNQQATNAANIGQAQVNGAMWSGGMQALGSLAGGAAGAAAIGKIPCWVAREVYGAENPQWRRFRTWLFTRSPNWFEKLYVKHGAQFALWISDKPRLKSAIRRWMDARIATLAH